MPMLCSVTINIYFCQLSGFIPCLCCNLYTASKPKMDCVEFALLFSFCNIVPVRKDFWSSLDALSISISQSEVKISWSDQSEVFIRQRPHSSMFGIGIVTLTLNFKMKSNRVFSDTEMDGLWISVRSFPKGPTVQCSNTFSPHIFLSVWICVHILQALFI